MMSFVSLAIDTELREPHRSTFCIERYRMDRVMARPRGFDRDDALHQAMLAFWAKGYEQTSISDLTAAMGIAAPSLYAAFGDKRRLFDEAVAHYQGSPGMVVIAEGLAAPTARDAMAAMLRAAAREYTDTTTHPAGCFVVSEPRLEDHRAASRAAIRARIQDGLDNGELPADTDVDALAAFYGVVVGGMSARARDGATRQDLEAVAETALRAWPALVP
jgi:AcrR family transcriptional regulator